MNWLKRMFCGEVKSPEPQKDNHREAFEQHEIANLNTPESQEYVGQLMALHETRWVNAKGDYNRSAQLADIVEVQLQPRGNQLTLTMIDVRGKRATLWGVGRIPASESWCSSTLKIRAYTPY